MISAMPSARRIRRVRPGNELVGPRLFEEPDVGVISLCGRGGERPAPAAKGADREGGQQGRFVGVAHGIGDRGVEVLPVDRVVEVSPPAAWDGSSQPARVNDPPSAV